MRIEDERDPESLSDYTSIDQMPVGFYDGKFAGYTGLFLKHYDGLVLVNNPMTTWGDSDYLKITGDEFMTRVEGRIVIERNV